MAIKQIQGDDRGWADLLDLQRKMDSFKHARQAAVPVMRKYMNGEGNEQTVRTG
jgi:hypothetical protein